MTIERTDEELLQAIAARDGDALGALYDRYGAAAFSLAFRITGGRQTAEEVVQEAFLSAWRGVATFRPERGSVRTWLFGIVHHRAIDALRARAARASVVALDEGAPVVDPEDLWATVEQRLDHEAIRRALAALPDEQRQSIELAYFGGFTYPEIARQLGVPLGTVKSRLRLGLEKLRALLAEFSLREPEPGGKYESRASG